MAGITPATIAARARGMTLIPGIEITAVHGGKDVHVLGYFLDESDADLQELLSSQRRQRLDRAREIAERLARMGAPIDGNALAGGPALGGKSVARPQIAEMLLAAGHVSTIAEAFTRYLSEEGPAYVPHRGPSPAQVVQVVGGAGGVASLAHPGYRGSGASTAKDELIPELVEAGLVALEAFHSSHDAATQEHYVALANQFDLAVTGGSDYHGQGTRRAEFFGVLNLPLAYFEGFLQRASVRCSLDISTLGEAARLR
jgi:predicted metal-dependent phosphoesterase TrpH